MLALDDSHGLYIGMMSGTSVDGIDAALVDFRDGGVHTIKTLVHPWPDTLRTRILALMQNQVRISLDDYGRLDVAMGACFADAAQNLIEQANVPASRIRAIGSHGQTLRHHPHGEHPFTLQPGDPSVIAERCGINVVAHFRQTDVAASGQGAPLLPAMHARLLATPDHPRVVLNLGGIANISVLNGDDHILGFDTGPGNGLLDAWCLRHRGEIFDRDGAFAASGQVDAALLQSLLADPYFAAHPPKSTGREHFCLAWLEAQPRSAELTPADVQATLLELTVQSVRAAILRHAQANTEVLVCGGGVHNSVVMRRLSESLAPRLVRSTATLGIDPDFLEALAFAWLARQRLLGKPGNLPAVTGACGSRVLGAIYAAPR